MSKFTQEQLDEMDSFDRFQAIKYGNILKKNKVIEDFENGSEEAQRELEKINEYWELEHNQITEQ